MTPRRLAPWGAAVLSVLVTGSVPSIARGQTAPGGDPGAGADAQARTLFAQGQLHYSLGEYQQAVDDFRRAYELSSAPGLLFNIAQAHRLNGECKRALEIYRHFVRLAPQSEHRGEAEMQIATLASRCGVPAPVSVGAPQTTKPPKDLPILLRTSKSEMAAQPAPRWSRGRRTSVALLAGGVGLGLGAAGLYWWNDDRHDRWRSEDRNLASPAPNTDVRDWITEQQRNDHLLESIQRMDTVDLIVAGVALSAIVAAAVTGIVFDR